MTSFTAHPRRVAPMTGGAVYIGSDWSSGYETDKPEIRCGRAPHPTEMQGKEHKEAGIDTAGQPAGADNSTAGTLTIPTETHPVREGAKTRKPPTEAESSGWSTPCNTTGRLASGRKVWQQLTKPAKGRPHGRRSSKVAKVTVGETRRGDVGASPTASPIHESTTSPKGAVHGPLEPLATSRLRDNRGIQHFQPSPVDWCLRAETSLPRWPPTGMQRKGRNPGRNRGRRSSPPFARCQAYARATGNFSREGR